MVLGDAFSILETFVWISSHVSRSITWSLLTQKASFFVKWAISTWSFMRWCQFINWLKFETRPSSLLNFGTAYTSATCNHSKFIRRLYRWSTERFEDGRNPSEVIWTLSEISLENFPTVSKLIRRFPNISRRLHSKSCVLYGAYLNDWENY